jgi:hypothetical protein
MHLEKQGNMKMIAPLLRRRRNGLESFDLQRR